MICISFERKFYDDSNAKKIFVIRPRKIELLKFLDFRSR